MKLLHRLDENFEEYFMGILLIGISTVMFVQIFMRFFGSSISWAEEICRYFYIWSVFLSISYTIKKRIILRVDLLVNMLPRVPRKFLEIALQLLSISFFVFLGYYSILTIQGVKVSAQTSPAMELPMYLVYLIIPVGFFLSALRSIQQIFLLMREPNQTELTGAEAE